MLSLLLATLICQVPEVLPSIQADEVVRFYPTYAFQTAATGDWTARVHGSVFEPEIGGFKRRLLLAGLAKLLDLDADDESNELFQTRAGEFLVDNERGKAVSIRLGTREVQVGISGANGQFAADVLLTPAELESLRKSRPTFVTNERAGVESLAFRAVLEAGDERRFDGLCQLISPTGTSVISDIDDTIKISDVTNRKKLLANTFLRPFEPVPGMAELYERWAKEGAAFHYLTASPWQLYHALEQFRGAAKFPAGTWHMKTVRFKDSTALDLLKSPEQYKPEIIEKILADFPQRQFILVGDSGERDPEIYGGIARKFPKQIERIYIREVLPPPANPQRYATAFAEVPREKWQVFAEAKEISLAIPRH